MRETNGPVIIKFEGMIGSGKSAMSAFIAHLFGQFNLRVERTGVEDELAVHLRPDQLARLHEKPHQAVLRVDSAEVQHAVEQAAETIDRLRRQNELQGAQLGVLRLVGDLLSASPQRTGDGAEVDAAWMLRQLLVRERAPGLQQDAPANAVDLKRYHDAAGKRPDRA